jgi:hypothetical protein
MIEKELGERNSTTARQRAAGSGQPAADNGQRFSLLQIDVEVEEPETSENPFVIHNIVWRRTQLLAVIMIHII